MAAIAAQAGVWDQTPLTKFRIPRPRRDAIARPQLLARLAQAIESNPVTLVSAPGGYGKSTLLAQFAADASNGNGQGPAARTVVWLAVDNEDNDSHRLFASLLRAVEQLELAWEMDPRALLTNAAGSASQQRAALAALVNALCTSTARRIVIVFDDFHRIDSAATTQLIESFIDRLPDHVSLLIGTRVEPSLPLARWRVHGELAEFVPFDLQFSENEAVTLAASRLGAAPDNSVVREALRRTHGWAAGLAMVLQSRLSAVRLQSDANESNDRHLYAYLAQEILAELPDDLQQFVLHSSILTELSPLLCAAVTGRKDAREVLESLYRRNLFLTAVDEQIPVLRFHDLFRDFLVGELERRTPGISRELHERAGKAETSLPRAIAHYLAAQCWDDAIVRIVGSGEAMLIEGGHATLERWIDLIPDSAQEKHASIGYLRGVCAWLRWDWPRAKKEFGLAVSRMNQPEYSARRLRCLFMYVDALNSSGDAAAAAKVLDEIAAQKLNDVSRAQLALQRAWHAVPQGDPKMVGHYHDEFLAQVEKDPARVCPATADLIHCLCIGMPRVAHSFDRYFELSQQAHPLSKSPWKFAALSVGLWGHFWYGRRDQVERLLQQGEVMQHQFGTIRLVAERLVQFKALYLSAIGQRSAALALTKAMLDALQTPEAAGHRAAWQRGYLHGLARQYWMAMDRDALAALLPQLLGPRRPAEWPFIDAATDTVRGLTALLAKDWPGAQAALETAARLHVRYRLPMTYADPRIGLAYVYLMQGDKGQAVRTFTSVYEEVINEQAIGLLLLEPHPIVMSLLDNLPAEMRRSSQHQILLRQLESWGFGTPAQEQAIDASIDRPIGPLAGLSERELEVLAQVAAGASNKHIARDLSLSLHTVKRHIANILDKMDCASRGQAADLYRRSAN
jgi:LuxR family maltose regulon positive regulatory protein